MAFFIPRGVIYHNLIDDLTSFFLAIFNKLDDKYKIKKFQERFAAYSERKFCVAFPFARTAIYFALKSKNFPKGSEILMPPITIKGILDVVLNLGLKPVFIDIDPNTFCFDEKLISKAITSKTRCILITYLFGMVPNMKNLIEHCDKNNLFVIEDFSHCLNGEYKSKRIGNFGQVGIYSSSSLKTLDTYGGGLLICDEPSVYKDMLDFQKHLKKSSRLHLLKKILTDFIRNFATQRFIFDFLR